MINLDNPNNTAIPPPGNTTTAKAKATRRLRICAIVCLCMLALFVIGQLLNVYQTRRELVSPLIPESLVRQITQQSGLHAAVSSVMLLLALATYRFKRYWWTILLVAFTLVGNQYVG
ncbi:MAG TPA: hypothetical protein VMH27_22275 [Puia sp.]|nr:hypothetical protein [Puia sp.]